MPHNQFVWKSTRVGADDPPAQYLSDLRAILSVLRG